MTKGNGDANLEDKVFKLTKEEFEEKLDEAIVESIIVYNDLAKLEKHFEKDMRKYHLRYYQEANGDIYYEIGERKRIGF